MGNRGCSTIVVEGANAKRVNEFLLEMAKNAPSKYQIKPVLIGDKELEHLVCEMVADDTLKL